MQELEKLFAVAKRKFEFDQTNDWYSGAETYLSCLQEEIDEVRTEIPKNRPCFLEDELGDIVWNYLNIVLALEEKSGITIESVLKRAASKYDERVTAIESGGRWQDVKQQQKLALAEELVLTNKRS